MNHLGHRITAYLDGDLHTDAYLKCERHLRRCRSCRELVDDHQDLRQRLQAGPAPAPDDDLTARILAATSGAGSPAYADAHPDVSVPAGTGPYASARTSTRGRHRLLVASGASATTVFIAVLAAGYAVGADGIRDEEIGSAGGEHTALEHTSVDGNSVDGNSVGGTGVGSHADHRSPNGGRVDNSAHGPQLVASIPAVPLAGLVRAATRPEAHLQGTDKRQADERQADERQADMHQADKRQADERQADEQDAVGASQTGSGFMETTVNRIGRGLRTMAGAIGG